MSKRLPPPLYEESTVAHSESADNNYVLIKIARQNVEASYRNVHSIQRVLYAVRRTNDSESIKGMYSSVYHLITDFTTLYSSFHPNRFARATYQFVGQAAAEVFNGTRGEVVHSTAVRVSMIVLQVNSLAALVG